MLNKIIVFIKNPTDLNVINHEYFKDKESKVFSFNYYSHDSLLENQIEHEIGERYLNQDDRLKIFDLVTKNRKWYESKKKTIEFEGINLLGLFDTHEFYSYVIPEVVNFLTIKRIIEKEKPSKIIITTNLSKIVETLVKDKKIEIKIFSNDNEEKLYHDTITIKQNISKFPITFQISKKKYLKIKKILEQTVCTFFNLWYKFNDECKDAVLLLEFDPASFPDFLREFNNFDKNIILINRRRTPVWSLQSINTLRNSKCKLVNFDEFLDEKEKNTIEIKKNSLSKKLDELYKDEDLRMKFQIEDFSFWPIINEVIINTYKQRLNEYLIFITQIKKLFEKINVKSIISLNVVGETEKIILNVNNNQKPSILLEHGFVERVNETTRFDVLDCIDFQDKIAVWGDIKKKYLMEKYGIDEQKIIVSGSPKHDLFFQKESIKKQRKEKIILIAPNPLTEESGLSDTSLHLRYQKILKSIFSIINDLSDVKIIVKLHPGQSKHNEELKKYFRKINSTVPIYLWTPVIDIIESCDAVITIQGENWGMSTMILESILLKKPVMNIVLNEKLYNFEHVKYNAILVVNDENDLSKNISDILFDEKFRERLILNSEKFVNDFLNNHGNASKILAKILCSY